MKTEQEIKDEVNKLYAIHPDLMTDEMRARIYALEWVLEA